MDAPVLCAIQGSEHPDDRRLPREVEVWLKFDVLPRTGEVVELPWPLPPYTGRVRHRVYAHVTMVEHVWCEGDEWDGDECFPLLVPRLYLELRDLDLDGDWLEHQDEWLGEMPGELIRRAP